VSGGFANGNGQPKKKTGATIGGGVRWDWEGCGIANKKKSEKQTGVWSGVLVERERGVRKEKQKSRSTGWRGVK